MYRTLATAVLIGLLLAAKSWIITTLTGPENQVAPARTAIASQRKSRSEIIVPERPMVLSPVEMAVLLRLYGRQGL
ncbi:hypothetical protein [Salidesulfovibrio onnuriiensis]|uniref:hypothetical protein n=1 Tax=Salidesulfovibrio onnuriiensis TaxID=2583823 RepID=UPI0011CAC1FB|nr:hypothetical protein [Salidesulfovibrio onnuriiensis]